MLHASTSALKICLACWTKGGYVGLSVGMFFFTNMLNFILRLAISWRGLKWVELNSASSYSHSRVPTGKHCSISWSRVLILVCVLHKLPFTWLPCCVISNGSGILLNEVWKLFAVIVVIMTKNVWILGEQIKIETFVQNRLQVIGLHDWNFILHYYFTHRF